MLLAAGALLLLASFTAGCGDDEPVSSGSDQTTEPGSGGLSTELTNRRFISQRVGGYTPVKDTALIFSFEFGKLGVTGGCNAMIGPVEISGSTIRWSESPSMTEMACDQDLMDQDVWISDLLTEGMDATLDGDDLTLRSGKVELVLLDLKAAQPDQPLIGTDWTLDTIYQGDTASSLPSGVKAPTLTISAGGTATVFGGCNRGSADVSVGSDGTSATFAKLALTKRFCGGGGSEIEASVTKVLDGEVSVEIEGSRLTLTKGELALGYMTS